MIRLLYPAALAVLTLLAAFSGGDDGQASPSSVNSGTTTASPSPSISPVTPAPIPATELTIGDPVEFPNDVALIVAAGCTQCDGPTTGINRLYYDALRGHRSEHLYSAGTHFFRDDDSIRMEDVWRVGLSDAGDVAAGSLQITGFAASLDGNTLAVSACVQGSCDDGGMVGASRDAVTVVHYSVDGGVSWQEMTRLQASVQVRAVLDDGRVVVAATSPADPIAGTTFQILPGGEALAPPTVASPVLSPIAIPGDGIAWTGRGGVVHDASGNILFELPPGGPHNLTGFAPYSDGKGQDLALASWQAALAEGWPTYVTLFGQDGTQLANYSSPVFLQVGAWLNRRQAIVSMSATPNLIDSTVSNVEGFTKIPAILDLDQAMIHPITRPFLDDGAEWGRNRIFAVQRGPFARVTGTGSCLNLRAEPSADAQALDCLADGVLLLDVAPASHLVLEPTPVPPWVEVFTPAGRHGFVSGDFLERLRA